MRIRRSTSFVGRPGELFRHILCFGRVLADAVNLKPEQEAKLWQIASYNGTDAEQLVKEAALGLVEGDARFRAAVRRGIAQADRGDFIEEDEMDARIEQMLKY
jgi:predicted transcriptional regulator